MESVREEKKMRCKVWELLAKNLNKAGGGGSMRFFALPKQPPPPTLDFFTGGFQRLRDAPATGFQLPEAPGMP